MFIIFLDVWENERFNEIHFKLNNSVLSNEIITNNYSDEKMILQNITIFGIQNEPKSVQVNGAVYNNFFYNMTENVSLHFMITTYLLYLYTCNILLYTIKYLL